MTLCRFKTWTLTLCTACLLLAGWMLYHSLSGGPMAGCGTGSGCDSVMSSPWAYILGLIPVSLPAVVVYLLLILCIAFWGSDASLDRFLRPFMLFLGGCIVGAALWFAWLQLGVLHAFCKYCSALHLLGCIAAVLVFLHFRTPRRFFWPLAGLVAAALFAVVQSFTKPFIYDSGRTEAPLPAFEEGEVPVIGQGETLTLLFDFQCSHCRRLHRVLPELSEHYRILLAPVPLSSACNPYIPASGIDRFRGSCQLTRLAMAVWYAKPGEVSAYWDFLLEGATPAEAENRAQELLGDGFASALADSRIEAYLRKVEELFGRTSSGESSGVPRFIAGRQWLVPETDDADELLNLLRQL